MNLAIYNDAAPNKAAKSSTMSRQVKITKTEKGMAVFLYEQDTTLHQALAQLSCVCHYTLFSLEGTTKGLFLDNCSRPAVL